jgi:nucleoside-diphosphate-sugar epimerase
MTLGNIVVTGANGQVGRQVLTSLQGKCQNLIALVRNSIELSADEVITNWLNSDQAKEAIANADAIVHLAGNLKPERGDYISANIKTTETLISSLNKNKNRRIIFLSYVGASSDSSNPYLSTKARAENLLQASGYPITILRCSHIIGSPSQPGLTAEKMLSQNGKSVTILGTGKQQIKPVFLGDVVLGIIKALEQNHGGVFDFTGPDIMTMDDLVKMINRNPYLKINHIPSFFAKLLPLITSELTGPLVEVMLANSLGNSQNFIDTFKFKFTSLKEEIWLKKNQ